MSENKRKPLGRKLRFEVFKRDSFTCQYCGRKAPDVVLQADHIEPVALGGSDEILNLITSCQPCNAGKGATALDDHQVLEKQRDELEGLEERRQQITMMLEWRDELQGLRLDEVDLIATRIGERTGLRPNASGKSDVRKWIDRYSFETVMRAVDDAFDAYLMYDGDEADEESWNVAFRKIARFASIIEQEADKPHLRRVLYIQGIIRRRSGVRRYQCVTYLEHLHQCGQPLDELERRAKAMQSLDDFEGPLDAWLVSIGKAF